MPVRKQNDFGLYERRREHDACGVGALVNISGERTHQIIDNGRIVLENLMHRGAAGADGVTGDGAGILFQIPHQFFVAHAGVRLPQPEQYGVAMVFGPQSADFFRVGKELLEKAVVHYGMRPLGWRTVPTDNQTLGRLALEAEPAIEQFFIDGNGFQGDALERALFMARKRAERLVNEKLGEDGEDFYIVSMSCRTINYKGMFLAPQLFAYYPDLNDSDLVSALAVVHQRYSTNTFPNWQLAQPFRMVCHNGEINTLSGNEKRIEAAETSMKCDLLGSDLSDLKPILKAGQSDSASFDNVLELLTMAGRSMPHSVMMMMPEAFGSRYHISTDKRAFYEYHASIMEPWDGPAAMIFTDGRIIGGTLDRNGLRPCRYVITTDGQVVMASEMGVIDFPPEQIREKGRLQPGRMFLVDTIEKRVVTDNEIKSRVARQKPYRRWLEKNRIELRGLFTAPNPSEEISRHLNQKMRVFGYTREELKVLLKPMAANGQEPIGSMGNDTPLAILSEQPKLLFNYFKQLFAQVTNPPIDPYREELVMSLMCNVGKQLNLLSETPEHCRQLKLPHPILTNEDIDRLRHYSTPEFSVATVPMLFEYNGEEDQAAALRRGMEQLIERTTQAIQTGATLIILSDRGQDEKHAPIPSLLATSGVHHGLLERNLSSEAGIVVESGEPREVMHFCLLCGFGAAAINPYLAMDILDDLYQKKELPAELSRVEIMDNYIESIKKGLLKTMSKMGISTLRSYRGAQLFEAIGLNQDVIQSYFSGVSSRIQGVGLDVIARDTLVRHQSGYTSPKPGELSLKFGGEYQYRNNGAVHGWNPDTISLLQHAVRRNDPESYAAYAKMVNEQTHRACTLRGLFEFAPGTPVPLEEVEPASEIVKRFCTGAMSHGSISKEAHETMAAAMNHLGGASNTGEGGEDPARYYREENAPDLNSAIKQVASARFGVTINYLAHAKELQIKMAQGAKPGEGGQLPGHKVTEEIARLRHSTPGVTLISPPPHHDIYSIEDLAQIIFDLKCSNPGVKVSVKLVSEVGVGTIAAGVAKGHADEVLISGHDGGTGASPLSSIKHTGCPWEMGLAETQQTLILNGLRDRIRVQTDGQLRTGRDVVIAALLGAERFGFGTTALISLGCIMMRKCHLGTCPVGVATQDPALRCQFTGKPEHLERFMLFIAEDARHIMAQLGFRSFNEMVGRMEYLRTTKAIENWRSRGLDLSPFFVQPENAEEQPRHQICEQEDLLSGHLDWDLLKQLEPAIKERKPVSIASPIRNVNRTVGTIISNHVTRAHGPEGLPDNSINIHFTGSAGQSFGAFLAPGITLQLTGDANDYLGKGLSGGRIVVRTPPNSPFVATENIIVGNTLLYGATAGEVFINGLAGERFAVRNSGVTAVVEGVGDHACEYMTGGTVIVLGRTGRNFAAGMSGGIAYVLDKQQLFDTLCNLDMVDIESVWQEEDTARLRALIEQHLKWTGSKRAAQVLENWQNMIGRFVKVIPIDYRRALSRLKDGEMRGTEATPATEEVFHHG